MEDCDDASDTSNMSIANQHKSDKPPTDLLFLLDV